MRQDNCTLEGMLDELYEWVEDAEAKFSNVLPFGNDAKSVEGQLSQHEVCTFSQNLPLQLSCAVFRFVYYVVLDMFSDNTGGDG